MADIFVSYAREDRDAAERLSRAFANCGWSVWWDRKIHAGQSFSEVIERELEQARCVVVLWSRVSIRSDWVINEAAEGARRKVLVPILIEDVRPPLEFRRLHAATLLNRDPSDADPALIECLDAIRARLEDENQARDTAAAPAGPPAPPVIPTAGNHDVASGSVSVRISYRRWVLTAAAGAAIILLGLTVQPILRRINDKPANTATAPSATAPDVDDTEGQTVPSSDSDASFRATTRRTARLAIPDAPVEAFADVGALLESVPSDATMTARGLSLDASSPRAPEEQRIVSTRAWLYAASRQDSNDYTLIIGSDPRDTPPQYMAAIISGLPPQAAAGYDALKAARDNFERFFADYQPGHSYDFYEPPIDVFLEGALYFNAAHAKGPRPGPQSLRPHMPSLWEIRPITSLVFPRTRYKPSPQ